MTALDDIRTALEQRRDELRQRVSDIEQDARRQGEPLDKDSEEQAQQTENDEVLSALEEGAIRELRGIDRALARIDSGDYGICSACGREIAAARLRAIPDTELCIECAE